MAILERTDEGVLQNPRGVFGPYAVDGMSIHLQIQQTFSTEDLLEENDGAWTVRSLSTGIFGTGQTAGEAIEDFEAALREHLDVLERQPALSDELEAQLRYLRQRLS